MDGETNCHVLRGRAYAMKKHDATRLHYDLRLEWNGVLLSWALPQGPSCHAGEIRNAIQMEDHRKEYLLFEGVHKTGPIMLWDRGTWEPHPELDNIDRCLRKGILRFTLYGEKLQGSWTLARVDITKNTGRFTWTLRKETDLFAAREIGCILEEQPNSISTGRSIEEIVKNWTRPKSKHTQQMMLFDEA